MQLFFNVYATSLTKFCRAMNYVNPQKPEKLFDRIRSIKLVSRLGVFDVVMLDLFPRTCKR